MLSVLSWPSRKVGKFFPPKSCSTNTLGVLLEKKQNKTKKLFTILLPNPNTQMKKQTI